MPKISLSRLFCTIIFITIFSFCKKTETDPTPNSYPISISLIATDSIYLNENLAINVKIKNSSLKIDTIIASFFLSQDGIIEKYPIDTYSYILKDTSSSYIYYTIPDSLSPGTYTILCKFRKPTEVNYNISKKIITVKEPDYKYSLSNITFNKSTYIEFDTIRVSFYASSNNLNYLNNSNVTLYLSSDEKFDSRDPNFPPDIYEKYNLTSVNINNKSTVNLKLLMPAVTSVSGTYYILGVSTINSKPQVVVSIPVKIQAFVDNFIIVSNSFGSGQITNNHTVTGSFQYQSNFNFNYILHPMVFISQDQTLDAEDFSAYLPDLTVKNGTNTVNYNFLFKSTRSKGNYYVFLYFVYTYYESYHYETIMAQTGTVTFK